MAKIATAEAWNVYRNFFQGSFIFSGDLLTKECAGPLRDIIIDFFPVCFFLGLLSKSSATFFFLSPGSSDLAWIYWAKTVNLAKIKLIEESLGNFSTWLPRCCSCQENKENRENQLYCLFTP